MFSVFKPMNDIADHEAQFHDHGEQVDAPYPQMSEYPLRTFLGKITDASDADGTYTINEQIHTGAAWTDGAAPGQYVGADARDINEYTEGQVDDLILCWEQYTEDGVIELVCDVLRLPPGPGVGGILYRTEASGLAWLTIGAQGTVLTVDSCMPVWSTHIDRLVAVDAEATPGYLGACSNCGVLRVDGTLGYADGGDYVLLSVTNDGEVRTTSGETAGCLEDVLAGDGTWIELTEFEGVITIANIGPGPSEYTGGCVNGCDKWVIFVDLDCIGNVRCIHFGDAGGSSEAVGPFA